MWSWLSKLDPNTVLGALAVIGSVATWAYHKVRGDQAASFEDTFRGLGKQVIHLLMADTSVTAATEPAILKARASELLWKLVGTSIPRNALTEGIANTLIEHVVGDTLKLLLDAENLEIAQSLPAQMESVANRAADVLKSFPVRLPKIPPRPDDEKSDDIGEDTKP